MSNELIDFVIVSIALLSIGIYGLSVKRNAIRMLFAVEIIINAANLNLVAFATILSLIAEVKRWPYFQLQLQQLKLQLDFH